MLDVSKTLFVRLNTEGVRYCHWKSNEHLAEALAGQTDLDLLVHPDDEKEFLRIIESFGCKKILSPLEKQFPGMSDYLGFDEASGECIHLHIHLQMVLGQKYIKNHYLPIEGWIFSNLDMKHGVAVPCTEVELIMLFIRAHMKVDLVSLLKHAIKDFGSTSYTAFPSAIESELSSLIAESDKTKLKILLEESQLPVDYDLMDDFFARFSAGEIKFYHIARTQMLILKALKRYRRNKSIAVYGQYFKFYVAELPFFRRLKIFKRKTLPVRGKAIALVGADGSGKSSLIEDLEQWLSWKLECRRYYYGIPKNTVSKANHFLQRVFQKLGLNFICEYVEAIFWLYTAKTRAAIYQKTRRDVEQGRVVISDRYPLKEFLSMDEPMDGPRLASHSRFSGSALARREAEIYAAIPYPDKVFALQVDIENLRQRKTDLDIETHTAKARTINNLRASDTITLVNANKDYNEVVLKIKKLIWKAL